VLVRNRGTDLVPVETLRLGVKLRPRGENI
jgi:hypothetical protein